MSEQQITEIEINIKEAENFITMGKALDRLHSNSDFKQIITDGFFREEAIRLVHLKGDPNMQQPERQQSVIKDLDGIGVLRNYFRTIYQRADWAENAIQESENELDQIRQEEMVG